MYINSVEMLGYFGKGIFASLDIGKVIKSSLSGDFVWFIVIFSF